MWAAGSQGRWGLQQATVEAIRKGARGGGAGEQHLFLLPPSVLEAPLLKVDVEGAPGVGHGTALSSAARCYGPAVQLGARAGYPGAPSARNGASPRRSRCRRRPRPRPAPLSLRLARPDSREPRPASWAGAGPRPPSLGF
ncbi:uncharacterized protein ACOB8E_004005 [Sarcophilus harrisii]